MNKIFPIKVEKANVAPMKFIEWKLHNVCNHNCSFCGAENKDGSQRWLTLEKYKEYVDHLATECQGQPFWIQLTGGEPTLFPELTELMRYIKSKGAFISIISNGSRTIRWWKEIKEEKLLDYLFLTYHSEQTNEYEHVAEIINLFHDEPISVTCLITHVISSVDKSIEAYDYFVENTGALINLKAMMTGTEDIFSLYTPDQLEKLKNKDWILGKHAKTKTQPIIPIEYRIDHLLKITNNDNSVYEVHPQTLMKKQENKFKGWECDIGRMTMRIDRDIIYRGVCEVGEKRLLSDTNISFTDDFIKCTSNKCFCGTDMIATKIRPPELYLDK